MINETKRQSSFFCILLLIFTFNPLVNLAQNLPKDNRLKTVRDFGAMGDGTTDDGKSIQTAINSGVGQIIFPSGKYKIKHSLVIRLEETGPISLTGKGTATILMEGEGPAIKFVGTHFGSADPKTFNSKTWEFERMPAVKGMEIVGKNPEADGIEVMGTMQLTITGVLIRKTRHVIHLVKRNRNVIISNSHIYHNNGIGIYLDQVNLHQINITGSHISYNAGGGIVVKGGIIRNLQIGSCDIEANMGRDKNPTANILINVKDGGSMRECAIVGCTIQHTREAPNSTNIRFIGHGPDDVRKVGKTTIANNVMSDAQHNIYIQYGWGFVITGNVIYKGYTDNIYIQKSNHIDIGANMLDKNPDYSTSESGNNIIIQTTNYLTINGIHLSGTWGEPAGILLDQCQYYNLTNSTLINCKGGILLKQSKNGKISGNFILDNSSESERSPAIRIKGGRENIITGNYITGTIEADTKKNKILHNYRTESPEESFE